ncbi:hypothetical protein QJS10_CPB21g00123 [Acorus calamus]|uniref:RING-type domain-containing protein n=1 Tax=Acorus calamus TaxID=4465 RepID=A0AAV9C2E1_ACOCL|nr:hypothetical protein QJS10_CPB21g00123 [Acorus calamus]
MFIQQQQQLLLQQLQPCKPPLMAQMAHESLPVPTFNLPFFDPTQGDRTSTNFSPLCELESRTMCNNQIVIENTRELSRTRKRRRDENTLINYPPSDRCLCRSSFSIQGGDLFTRMQMDHQELERFIFSQTEKTMVELEQKRRRHLATVLRVVEDRMQCVLRGKDEEIAILGRKNSSLEERVRVLEMEGQIWKTLAQNNEATITALQVDIENARNDNGAVNLEAEDSASSCHVDDGRYCRGCNRCDISVLVLPCRHLCLCSECDPKTDTCPVCMGAKNASLRVRLS